MATRARTARRGSTGKHWTSRARELLNGRSLAIGGFAGGHIGRFDARVFEEHIAMAVEFGATHAYVGWLPFRYGTWYLPDNTDPYASWSNGTMAVFRTFPPKALRAWIPLSTAKPLQAVFEAQMRILRKYGLKGKTSGVEPHWLPEGVYEAHPHWRGPECQLTLISRRPYFAPSIDEPEVLDLYREAFAEIAARFPEIEEFTFMGNDSGAGISWSPCLYPGMNGPTRWRARDPGERIANWLKAMQEGAAAKGVRIRVHAFSSGLPPADVASTQAKLGPGLFINWRGAGKEGPDGPGAGMSGGLWSSFYPVVGLGNPIDFVGGLQGVYRNPKGDHSMASLSYDAFMMPVARVLLESFLANPGTGLINRDTALLRAAERLAGSAEAAETLVGVWQDMKYADFAMSKLPQKGFGYLPSPWALVSSRWLIRPLVPAPEKLTPAEKAYYRPFMFTTDSEEQLAELSRVLGKPVFRGSCATWMARWNLVDAINRMTSARGRVLGIAKACKDRRLAAEMSLYAARIGAYACMAETMRNVIMYQYALDTASQPQFGPNMMDYDDNMIYDQRALVMRKTVREEVDNTAELLEILDSQKDPVLFHAGTSTEESVFALGPNLKHDLRRKLKLMMEHWQDHEKLYPAFKEWEFEPEPKGNIVK